MQSPLPRFRVWLRRDHAGPGPYALRFEVTDGRGTLILPQSAGTAAAPAVPSDSASGLTASDLDGTRFLVVRNGQSERLMFQLGPFSETALSAVPETTWVDLLITRRPDGIHLVFVPEDAPEQTEPPRTRKATPWSPKKQQRSSTTTQANEHHVQLSDAQPAKERTAAERITHLEESLRRSQKRTALLTRRVAELERQVESLGGTVAPFEMDTRGD